MTFTIEKNKHGSKERSLSLGEYGLKYVGSKDVLTCFKIIIKVYLESTLPSL